jgi:hypothetical protein
MFGSTKSNYVVSLLSCELVIIPANGYLARGWSRLETAMDEGFTLMWYYPGTDQDRHSEAISFRDQTNVNVAELSSFESAVARAMECFVS